ncbi:MAG: tetratricopeptide repeat protein [Deltaproteobacteria bacterium]|nr:tetratricopeptide repeat protein [Deltaproteobacteria bacterium]
MTKTRHLGRATGVIFITAATVLFSWVIGCEQKSGDAKKIPPVTGTAAPGDKSLAQAKEYFDKGVQFSLKGQYNEAVSSYKESLKLNPRSAEAHSNLGFTYLDKGDIDGAVSEQKEALAINPNFPNAFYGMALAYEKKGNKQETIKNLEEFMKYTEPHSLWWNKAGEKLANLKGEGKEGKK